jgi:hypothetical protein
MDDDLDRRDRMDDHTPICAAKGCSQLATVTMHGGDWCAIHAKAIEAPFHIDTSDFDDVPEDS